MPNKNKKRQRVRIWQDRQHKLFQKNREQRDKSLLKRQELRRNARQLKIAGPANSAGKLRRASAGHGGNSFSQAVGAPDAVLNVILAGVLGDDPDDIYLSALSNFLPVGGSLLSIWHTHAKQEKHAKQNAGWFDQQARRDFINQTLKENRHPEWKPFDLHSKENWTANDNLSPKLVEKQYELTLNRKLIDRYLDRYFVQTEDGNFYNLKKKAELAGQEQIFDLLSLNDEELLKLDPDTEYENYLICQSEILACKPEPDELTRAETAFQPVRQKYAEAAYRQRNRTEAIRKHLALTGHDPADPLLNGLLQEMEIGDETFAADALAQILNARKNGVTVGSDREMELTADLLERQEPPRKQRSEQQSRRQAASRERIQAAANRARQERAKGIRRRGSSRADEAPVPATGPLTPPPAAAVTAVKPPETRPQLDWRQIGLVRSELPALLRRLGTGGKAISRPDGWSNDLLPVINSLSRLPVPAAANLKDDFRDRLDRQIEFICDNLVQCRQMLSFLQDHPYEAVSFR